MTADQTSAAPPVSLLSALPRLEATRNEPSPMTQELVQAAFESLPLGLATFDRNLCFTQVNAAFAKSCGVPADRFRGCDVAAVLPHWAAALDEQLKRSLQGGVTVERELWSFPSETDKPQLYRNVTQPLRRADAGIFGVSAMLVDITERRQAETALRESQENYRCALELNPHVPWTFDPEEEFFQSSSRLTDFVNLPPGPMSRTIWASVVHPDDLQAVWSSWDATLASGRPYDHEYRMRTLDGTFRWMRARASARRDSQGRILRWYGVLEDVDDRHRTEQALREKSRRLELASRQLAMLAREDHLTGLANRRHFDLILEQEIRLAQRSGRPVALVMIDVDRFKRYNDLYGHVAGDACLRQVAATLSEGTRTPQDLVARYGGEEFALVLPGATEAQARQVAERAIERTRELCIEHSGSLPGRVTLSAGVAAMGPIDPQANPPWVVCDLIQLADIALYAAKEQGRDRCVAGSSLAQSDHEEASSA